MGPDVDFIAKVCHEANKAYCEALGDHSQPSWEDAPDWQKSSEVNGVLFLLDNPNAGPESSHECWMKQKQAEGWKYSEFKDVEAKRHPSLMPFDCLPAPQKAKNFIFRAIVHAMK